MNFAKENIKADLHMHTSFSDGKLSPKELINQALKVGLSIISITDHDNVNGLDEAIEYGERVGIKVIPGVELSTGLMDKEVHILGYFIDHKSENLLKFLTSLRYARITRLQHMISKLNDMGSKITIDSITADLSEDISVGRPHVAKALVKEGFVKTRAEAFMKYIGDGKPAFVKKPVPNAKEAIQLISSIGGLSFVAHPGKMVRGEMLDELLKYGLDGVEVIHPSHGREDIEYFSSIASDNFLLVSGGSDFHGIYDREYGNMGNYVIPSYNIVNMRRRLF
ncbi:MAG: PHP domain-containing protein [Ignavibacteriae bacterium]|nr:PHP domain-containing protein [Ignavibacteriota bacterium]MCB9244312.1 PHP domain-containing protein [Ignavibacteriales bacterium]